MKKTCEKFDDHANVEINEALSQAEPPRTLTVRHVWGKGKKKTHTDYTLDFVEMFQVQENKTSRQIMGYWNDDWNSMFDWQQLQTSKGGGTVSKPSSEGGGTGSQPSATEFGFLVPTPDPKVDKGDDPAMTRENFAKTRERDSIQTGVASFGHDDPDVPPEEAMTIQMVDTDSISYYGAATGADVDEPPAAPPPPFPPSLVPRPPLPVAVDELD